MGVDPLDDVLLVAIHPDRREGLRLSERLPACDPDALWSRAAEHGVELALARAVRTAHDVDARFLVRARDTVQAAHARTEDQLRCLTAADAALAGAGIPALWLRGPALSVAAFGDPFARRPGRDLDLLVRSEHLHRAQVAAPGIDVADRAPGLTAPFASLFARSRTVELGGRQVRTLADPDHVAVLQARAAGRWRFGDWLDLASLLGSEAGPPPVKGRVRRLLRRLRGRLRDNR